MGWDELYNEYGVPFESVRFSVSLYADGTEGPEHWDDYGPFDTEAEAQAAAVSILDEKEEPEADEYFWQADIKCGEFAELDYSRPVHDEFNRWCPWLRFGHGYSNVSWCAADGWEVKYIRDRGKPAWEWRRRT